MYTKIEAHYVYLHACVESKVPAGRKARMLSQKQDVHSIPIRKNLKEREYTHYKKMIQLLFISIPHGTYLYYFSWAIILKKKKIG